jgi:hypothetical protein
MDSQESTQSSDPIHDLAHEIANIKAYSPALLFYETVEVIYGILKSSPLLKDDAQFFSS